MNRPQPDAHHQTPSGWADDRLMQAYDLIHAAWEDHRTKDDGLNELRDALAEIESADDAIAQALKERAA